METGKVGNKWRMPDELWDRIRYLLPEYPKSPKGGRPRANLRNAADGIFYVLRTGCQWKALPREFGAPSTVHDYFQAWVRSGVFARIWAIALEEYDDLKGLEWSWQAIDGAMTKAPLGGEKDGSQPHRSWEIRGQTLDSDRRGRHSLGRRRRRGQRQRSQSAR
jgi:transposase